MKLSRSVPLFWRMFGLLLGLLVVSFALWSQGFALKQQYPRAQVLAGQLSTAVNLTRNALLYAQPQRRETLLAALNQDERVGVYLREPTDTTLPLEDTRYFQWLAASVHETLGKDTELALKVNGESGLWVSFNMGGKELGVDSYWLRFDVRRLEPRSNNPTRWWLWMGSAVLVALIGAALMSRRLAVPLSALAQRTQAVADGQMYEPLPERGPREIAQVNAAMNRMVQALAAQESERSFMLASLSHDLRTPLARLRLEVEMAALSEDTHAAMVGDVAQIDAQLTQLTDYVTSQHAQLAPLRLDGLLHQSLARTVRDARVQVHWLAEPPECCIAADSRLLARALDNVIANALRYGCGDEGMLALAAWLHLAEGQVWVVLADGGAGMAASESALAALLQPFQRGNVARTHAQGSGLGLAIVDRVMRQHGGSVGLASGAWPALVAPFHQDLSNLLALKTGFKAPLGFVVALRFPQV